MTLWPLSRCRHIQTRIWSIQQPKGYAIHMSRDIWVISDTHLHHANILTFKDSVTGRMVRGDRFNDVDHMDQCLLDNWNSVVKQGDIVYHLGDVFIGAKEKFAAMWPKFNGSKRLIVGNHDDIKFLSSGGFFKKVQMWRMFPEYGLVMSHVPLHPSNLLRMSRGSKGTYPQDATQLYGIHGHIHHHQSPEGPYRNVSVEAIDYTPIHIEDLAAEAAEYVAKT